MSALQLYQPTLWGARREERREGERERREKERERREGERDERGGGERGKREKKKS